MATADSVVVVLPETSQVWGTSENAATFVAVVVTFVETGKVVEMVLGIGDYC